MSMWVGCKITRRARRFGTVIKREPRTSVSAYPVSDAGRRGQHIFFESVLAKKVRAFCNSLREMNVLFGPGGVILEPSDILVARS